MEKRYQVFVSSTYKDLADYRKLVVESLLKLDAFPVGMELFPASDDDAWTFIQRVIDSSDYYLVIVGGRYGSVDEDGVSFTEKEYDYAVEKGKAVVAFLHPDPSKLPKEHTETDPQLEQKLEDFKQKAKQKLCRFWTTREELIIAVLTSFQHLTVNHPAVGWVRAQNVKTAEDATTLFELQKQVQHLQKENLDLRGRVGEQQEASVSEEPTPMPAIVNGLPGLRRLVEVQWATEAPDGGNDRVRASLSRTRDKLLEFVIDIDDKEHRRVITRIRQVLLHVNTMFATAAKAHPIVSFGPEREDACRELASQALKLVSELRSLQRTVDTEDWTKR